MAPPKKKLTPEETRARMKELSVPKFTATPEEVIEYAKIAVKNDRICDLIKAQQMDVEDGTVSDEVMEDKAAELSAFVRKHIDELGKPWQLRFPYKAAFLLIHQMQQGRLAKLDSPEAKEILKKMHAIKSAGE